MAHRANINARSSAHTRTLGIGTRERPSGCHPHSNCGCERRRIVISTVCHGRNPVADGTPDELTHGDPLGLSGALHLITEAARRCCGNSIGVAPAAVIEGGVIVDHASSEHCRRGKSLSVCGVCGGRARDKQCGTRTRSGSRIGRRQRRLTGLGMLRLARGWCEPE